MTDKNFGDLYHGFLEEDLRSGPRRQARRLFKTNQRPKALFRRVNRLPSGAQVLDVGCGTGSMLATIASIRPDLELTGMDLVRPPHITYHGEFFEGDITSEQSVLLGRFDLVFSSMVIEHLADGPAFIRRLSLLAKPGGLVVVHTMNHRSLLISFYNDPTHVRPYSKLALTRAAFLSGLEVLEAQNERSWVILLFSPLYHLYQRFRGMPIVIPFFWEHLLAIQTVLVARVPEDDSTTE